MSIYLVGSKIDLGQTQPLTYELRQWMDGNQIRHIYVSSDWNKGIILLRTCLVKEIYDKHRSLGLFIHRDHLLDLYISTIGYCPTIVYDSCIAFDNNNQTSESYHVDEQSKNCSRCKAGSQPLRPIDFDNLNKDPKSMQEFTKALENICRCLDNLIYTVCSSLPTLSPNNNTAIITPPPYPLLTILNERDKRKRNGGMYHIK